MKKFLRRTITAISVAGLVTMLSACGGAGPSSSSKSNVSLRVIVYTSNPDQLALLNSLASEFMAMTPEVSDVKFESIANAQDLTTKLTAELQTNSPPDATWMSVEDAKRYSSAGVLVDLGPTLRQTSGFNHEELIPELQAAWVDGDAQFGMPFSTSTMVLYYNADMFRGAGIPTPDEMIASGTWDWDHLRSASATIKKTLGVPGFTPKYDNIQPLYPIMYAYGAMPWDEATSECTMNTQEMEEALQLLHDMIYVDESTTLPGQGSAVFDGSAAMSIAYLSSIPLLKDAPFEWGAVPTPAGSAGSQPTIGQSAYVAFNKGKAPDLTAKLIAHITNSKNSEKLSAFWLPSREPLLTAEKLHASQPLLSVEQFEPIVQGTVDDGRIIPVAASGSAAGTTLLQGLNEFVFTPSVNMGAAMTSICNELQPVLEN